MYYPTLAARTRLAGTRGQARTRFTSACPPFPLRLSLCCVLDSPRSPFLFCFTPRGTFHTPLPQVRSGPGHFAAKRHHLCAADDPPTRAHSLVAPRVRTLPSSSRYQYFHIRLRGKPYTSHMQSSDANGRRYQVGQEGGVAVDDTLAKGPLPPLTLPRLRAAPRCGVGHCLALTVAGDVLSWATARGGNRFGQLGQGAGASGLYEPKRVLLPAGVAGAVVSAGETHSAIADTTGVVWTFGCDRWLQLGQNTLWKDGAVWRRTPVRVDGDLAGRRIIDCACGRDHTLALADDGRALAWGRGEHGQLFGASRRPFTAAPGISSILSQGGSTRIAAHNNCSCALLSTGRVVCIGQCGATEKAKCANILGALLADAV